MAASPLIILTGSAKFGESATTNTDYSCWVTALTVTRRRNLIDIPATMCDGQASQRAGTTQDELTISWIGDNEAASFWAELWDVIGTDSAELYFECTLKSGSVSTDNPEYSGTIIVAEVPVGGTVGELSTGSATFPVIPPGVGTAYS
jgi:hypothetical protein